MQKKVVIISLVCLFLIGGVLVISRGEPTSPPPTEIPEEKEESAPELPPLPVLTVGDLVFKENIEEYKKYKKAVAEYEGVKYEEPDYLKTPPIQTGDTIKVSGRVEEVEIKGRFPDFTGTIKLGPSYDGKTLTVNFDDKEEVKKIRDLQERQWITVQGEYSPDVVKRYKDQPPSFSLYLLDSKLLSVESPVKEELPPEELKVDAMSFEELDGLTKAYAKQRLSKGESVKIFGRIDSVAIFWKYPENIQARITFRRGLGYEVRAYLSADEETVIRKLTKIPGGTEVIIKGTYEQRGISQIGGTIIILGNCSLIYPEV